VPDLESVTGYSMVSDHYELKYHLWRRCGCGLYQIWSTFRNFGNLICFHCSL